MLTAADKERIVYGALFWAAETGSRCPSADDLCALLEAFGCDISISTTVYVIHRLEKQGLIHVVRFQWEREIMITATGKWTASAKRRKPHWRSKVAA